MRIEASRTGDAAAGPGGYANTGVHIGDVYLLPASPVRSGYLHQVRRIAPPELLARERELAELTAFCRSTSPAGAYMWWRAPAWAGKTALMSWFALHPPPNVRVVSFFITARLAGQSGRAAFVDNVLEQLQALVGGPAVAVTDAARATRLLGLLDTAAHACRAAGETLVLLVDGLDEDQSADAVVGEDRSIAALLPVEPPAGMRVVVAGRPNPPIPGDVPAHHPLRTAAVHPLTTSAAAQVARTDMERELSRLLRGSPAEQDLLGLLVAAGGGLTGADLAELTGQTRQQVDDQLRTVASRSFTRRDSRFRPGELPDVYLLGHEELHAGVVAALGDERLATHRSRLHEWADRYRDRRWPRGTPEYLLHGYHSMLLASGDTARAIELSTDPDRHHRMLDASGGDAHAMDEIELLLDTLADADPVDLPATARLAVHRDHLRIRGIGIPARLPAVWAALGFYDRALSLARSVGARGPRTESLVSTADALFAAGQSELAHQAIDQVVAEACADSFLLEREGRLSAAMTSLAKAGEIDRVADVDRLTSGRGHRRAALLAAAGELADSGARARAQALLREFELAAREPFRSPARTAVELAKFARALAVIGDRKRAWGLIARARDLALAPDDPDGGAESSLAVVRCLNALGARRRARAHARKATSLVRRHTDAHPIRALENAVRALAEAGHFARAYGLVRKITEPSDRKHCAEHLAVACARQGDAYWAAALLDGLMDDFNIAHILGKVGLAFARADDCVGARVVAVRLRDEFAHHVRNPGPAIVDATKIFCALGELDAAEATARSTTGSWIPAEGLTAVAESLAGRGDTSRAESLLRQVEAAVLGSQIMDRQSDGYVTTAKALITAGDLTSARVIADRLPDPLQRAELLHAEVIAGVADPDSATRLIELAEEVKETAGEQDRGNESVRALAWAAAALLRSGDVDRAHRWLREAEALIDGGRRANAPGAAITMALVHAGEPQRALDFVHRNRGAGWEVSYQALLAAGRPDSASELARDVEAWYADVPSPDGRIVLRAMLVEPLIAVGEADRARTIARDVIAYLRATPEPDPPLSSELAVLVAGVLAVHDPREVPDVVERVVGRIRAQASTVWYLDQGGLAAPVARAMVRAGDLDGALALNAVLTDATQRAWVLRAIAVALLADGDAAAARPLLAEALRSSDSSEWSCVVEEAGDFLPDVVDAVGAEVVALLRSGQRRSRPDQH
ncbi:hypothetical protein LZ318_40985 [Saccharopolyspora indica]|uniref:hypothetical protein n=1 Tax=Saccharopolyspora indica TaxID=1229659 RepID=UPI0022EB02B2|nr:hypothetical protein [Saccharopolyspora indica]MDA3646837.1 hypothetical protein [Saccharopolyspora indica]